jgi:hypothetical protein
MKDDLHDGTLQLLTPQKLPVSFGALGAHKNFCANFSYILCYVCFA